MRLLLSFPERMVATVRRAIAWWYEQTRRVQGRRWSLVVFVSPLVLLCVFMCCAATIIAPESHESDEIRTPPAVVAKAERAAAALGPTQPPRPTSAPEPTSIPEVVTRIVEVTRLVEVVATPTPSSEARLEPLPVAQPAEAPIPTATTAPTSPPPPPTATEPPPATLTSWPSTVPADAQLASLLAVVDGDTIDILTDDTRETVRYIGIDTPKKGDPGFGAATEANAEILGPGALYLVADTSDRDSFGRLLRYVYTQDGRMVNQELVAQGWAQPVEYPPDTRYASEFRRVAGEAASAGLGFWSGTASDRAMPYALTRRSANIRSGPGVDFAISQTAPANTPLTVFGRNEAGDWLQVRTPDRSGGWISAGLVALNVAVSSVSVPNDIPQPVKPTSTPTLELPPTPPAAPPLAPPAVTASVAIGQINFDGAVPRVESDEYAEIANRGSTPVDLGGWRLNAGDPGQDFWFPAYVLQPGASCRVYTNEVHPESCGFSFGSGKAIWNNKGDCGGLFDPAGALASQFCY